MEPLGDASIDASDSSHPNTTVPLNEHGGVLISKEEIAGAFSILDADKSGLFLHVFLSLFFVCTMCSHHDPSFK